MKCSQARKLFIHAEEGFSAADLDRHLQGCPSCRRLFDRMQTVRKLVSLKKHEAPPAGFEARLLAGIRARLREEERPDARTTRLWDVLTGGPLPALRYAMAAAFVLLVAVHIFSISQFPEMTSPWFEAQEAGPGTGAVAAGTNEAGWPGVAGLQVVSNLGPPRIDYGPGVAVPVNLEY